MYESLKTLPKEMLLRYAQNPMGGVPQYMAIAALQYQNEIQNSKPTLPPQGTVKDEVIRQAVQPKMAQGIQQLPPQQPQPQPQQMQPQEPVMHAAHGGLAELHVPDHMFQEKHMAGGGIVAFDGGGEVPHFDGTDGSLVSNPYAFNPSAPGISRATMEYRNALANSEPSRFADYIGSPIMDVLTLPGQLAFDQEHYKKTGELLPKYKTQGWLPRSGRDTIEGRRADERKARETAIDQKAAADRAQYDKYLTQAPNLNTPRAPTGPDFTTVANMVSDLPSRVGAGAGGPGASGPGAGPRQNLPKVPGGPDQQYDPTKFELPIAPTIPRTTVDVPKELSVEDWFKENKESLKAAGIDPEYYSKKEAKYKERAGKLDEDKKNAGLMALSEFGFRLAGSKSPYFGQAAGEAGVGALQTYGGELKDLKKREDALQDAQEKNEDAKYLLARGDAGKAQDAIEKRNVLVQNAKTKQAEIDSHREEVTATLANQLKVTGMNNTNSMAIARMQVNGQMEVAKLQRELGLDNAMATTLVTTATKNFESLLGPELIKAKTNPDYVIDSNVINSAWATSLAQARQAVSQAKGSVSGVQSTAPTGGLPPLSSFDLSKQ